MHFKIKMRSCAGKLWLKNLVYRLLPKYGLPFQANLLKYSKNGGSPSVSSVSFHNVFNVVAFHNKQIIFQGQKRISTTKVHQLQVRCISSTATLCQEQISVQNIEIKPVQTEQHLSSPVESEEAVVTLTSSETLSSVPVQSETLSSVPVQSEMISSVPIQSLEAPAITALSTKSLMFPEFPVIQGFEVLLLNTHSFTGLPWWSVIVISSLVLRSVIILPLTILEDRNREKCKAQAPELKIIAKKINMEVRIARQKNYWTEQKTRLEYHKKMKEKIRELQIRDNCHPMKNIVSLYLKLPIFIGLSFAFRNIATRAADSTQVNHSDFLSLAVEGMAWFPDLTLADTTFVIPVMVGLVSLLNHEMQYLKAEEITKLRKYMAYIYRTYCFAVIPISACVPSAMAFFWLISGLGAASTSILLDHSSVRRLFKLSKNNFESKTPVQNLIEKARVRYLNKK